MGYTVDQAKGIEINGKVYPCDPGDQSMMHGILYHFPEITQSLMRGNKLSEQLNELTARAHSAPSAELKAEMQALRDDVSRVHEEVIAACITFLHGTLGEDEYEEIFAGQRVNMMRLFNLCAYIYAWANADRAEIVSQYVDGQEVGDAADHAAE